MFHRMIALCLHGSANPSAETEELQMMVQSQYARITREVLMRSHEDSRISKNGLYLSIHLASIRAVLERLPQIKYELIDHDVYTALVKLAYDNTEFPLPLDPRTGLPVSVPPPDHPFPVISLPIYFSLFDLINLLAY